jgi:hypothetical protein
MDPVKRVSYLAGKAVQITKNGVEELAEKHDFKGKAEHAKMTLVNKYEGSTGRNATVDQAILKYSAVTMTGAVAISAAPAIIVASAVGASVYANSQPIKDKINSKYHVVTGRNAKADLDNLGNKVSHFALETTTSFKEGMQSEQTVQPNLQTVDSKS